MAKASSVGPTPRELSPNPENGSLTSSTPSNCSIAALNVEEFRRVRTRSYEKSAKNRRNKSRSQMNPEYEPRRASTMRHDSIADSTSTRHQHRTKVQTKVHSARRRRRRNPVEEPDNGTAARIYRSRDESNTRPSTASLRSPRRHVEQRRASFIPDILPVLRTLGLDTGVRPTEHRKEPKPRRTSTVRRHSYDEDEKVVRVRTVRRTDSDNFDHTSTTRPRVAR